MPPDPSVYRASLLDRLVVRAPRYFRYVRDNPSWLLMFVFGRTLAGRRIERLVHGARYSAPLPVTGPTAFAGLDLHGCVRSLVQDGIALGLRLPTSTVTEISGFAAVTPCFARDRQDRGFLPGELTAANSERSRDVIAAYYFEAVEDCPAISAVRNDPALRTIAAAYLGRSAVWNRTRLWWSFPAARVSDADLHAASQDKYHFDMNGWRTLKFFFYLTTVTEADGPHRCIPGTHRRRPLRHQLTMTVGRPTDELERVYGKEHFVTVTGDAGDGFVEDPYVFHTGSLCRDKPRLILEIEFGGAPALPIYHYGRLG
jgi:hypothetical protein